ncbi:ABC transporter substrate-binding protein [Undibacterium sp. RTI2.1]|uniref:MlaC/ttg2D family ABC transporter substrate-binding protein n=1 Tax=unclassified Undibacterium TaxID=2630295 RepID=UPI002AB3B936|nr:MULTISPECIES: ABC transporter substrate-binding protein [unclassified Undibacterium]MDY7540178.1 ABC transporter substrate-binding protein [Undibacterium sp. 5I1]MEB0030352.1 ABC transporter substrate-binding protein [Undibacterium sp. RTI2.1]MEB0115367.1 ABC transporter substrate-binding protein [Undibacterium sp. RTI2.2]MEB0230575.1 ABC transporter substrate-binding protein [Undibacterium sp. 10I3]MEB0257105.1 ABC transporter substrate-binding protein [Undibacterium sp. 5I1]
MKLFRQFILFMFASFAFVGSSMAADEAADQLVKRLSQEIMDIAKSDKDIQSGNQKRVYDLVETKVLPFVDFQRMTSLAAGKSWRDATPEQQKQLINEFRTLLVFTYSGAISQIKDQRLEFKPFRAAAEDIDVEVRSQVIQKNGEALQLNYRLEKLATGWKIYDINVLGAWLVETYKGTFTAEITKSGIDGLIKTLSEKNKKLAAGSPKK